MAASSCLPSGLPLASLIGSSASSSLQPGAAIFVGGLILRRNDYYVVSGGDPKNPDNRSVAEVNQEAFEKNLHDGRATSNFYRVENDRASSKQDGAPKD
jgi:hypothetical protein